MKLSAKVIVAVGMLLGAMQVRADVKPASPFTDHMVLQQGASVPFWGTADAGETVTVTLGGQSQSVAADADGKWMLRLSDLQAGGPFEVKIAGKNSITLSDVLVGEVWLCSGQSNMDFTVAKTEKYYFAGVNDEEKEVAAANYPNIRMFSGQTSKSLKPKAEVAGQWKVCNPENVKEFSAVGYFFARDLQKALNVPVGIITETFGASTCESWVSRDALEAVPELKPMLEKFDAKVAAYTPEVRQQDEDAKKKFEQAATTAPKGGKRRGPANHDPVNDQHNPTVMYNGMIAPVIPYAIKGVLWYQGESILDGAAGIKLYPLVQSTLVKDWRARWGEGDFPFYIVQIAAYKGPNTEPVQHSSMADTRAAQQTILSLPNTGMAITIDIGDVKNVHPKDKQDVGDRLTRIALAKTYGQSMEFSGPMYDSMQIDGNAVRIKFTHVGGGLVAKGGPLKQFIIAGKDGKYVAADAKIDGDAVVVTSPDVTEPVSVRYAWADYPEGCNLYNADGLPAVPFQAAKP